MVWNKHVKYKINIKTYTADFPFTWIAQASAIIFETEGCISPWQLCFYLYVTFITYKNNIRTPYILNVLSLRMCILCKFHYVLVGNFYTDHTVKIT